MNHESIKVTIMSKNLSTYERKMQNKQFKQAYEQHYKELLFSELLISIMEGDDMINSNWLLDTPGFSWDWLWAPPESMRCAVAMAVLIVCGCIASSVIGIILSILRNNKIGEDDETQTKT